MKEQQWGSLMSLNSFYGSEEEETSAGCLRSDTLTVIYTCRSVTGQQRFQMFYYFDFASRCFCSAFSWQTMNLNVERSNAAWTRQHSRGGRPLWARQWSSESAESVCDGTGSSAVCRESSWTSCCCCYNRERSFVWRQLKPWKHLQQGGNTETVSAVFHHPFFMMAESLFEGRLAHCWLQFYGISPRKQKYMKCKKWE